MTSMQPQQYEQDSSGSDLFGVDFSHSEVSATESPDVSFGSRLSAAREARGLDVESCAQSLRLPARVLRQLERDQYAGSDSKVYLASYIGKYGRFVGVDEAVIQAELDRIRQSEPLLVATGGISHSRFLFDRYATAATYVILTAVIVVPMIWLGVRGTLDRDLSHLAPLDSAPVAQTDMASPGSVAGASTDKPLASVKATKSAPSQDQPLLASMAPFPNMDSGESLSEPKAADAAKSGSSEVTGTGAHSLNLSMDASSWVEVLGADGERLEYGLLPAGSNKTYHSDKPLDVRIGNATGVRVRIDGQSQQLNTFQHANVAHFRVQMQDGKASAASL
jgi:cytoskeleton protein RodZ